MPKVGPLQNCGTERGCFYERALEEEAAATFRKTAARRGANDLPSHPEARRLARVR